MATYRHWSVSLWRDPDDVSHCRILSPDKTEWRLISATLCGWRRCFVTDQLWFMTRIWEEEEEVVIKFLTYSSLSNIDKCQILSFNTNTALHYKLINSENLEFNRNIVLSGILLDLRQNKTLNKTATTNILLIKGILLATAILITAGILLVAHILSVNGRHWLSLCSIMFTSLIQWKAADRLPV